MPDRTDLQELGRKSTMRRKDLLRQLGLPEEELKAFTIALVSALCAAFDTGFEIGAALAADNA